jgi:ATP-dependent Clp protease ATP-binding subunit ClpC
MFERFTEQAIKSIMYAQEEARGMGHNYVGTEQILLGLFRSAGIAMDSLNSMSSLPKARIEVENKIGRGGNFVSIEIPFTPRAKRILELSWDVARELEVNHIGTEHILLGMLRLNEGTAVDTLHALGVDTSALKKDVHDRIHQRTEKSE